MEIDLELYRKGIRVSTQPLVRLSVIDIYPDYPEKTLVFLHGFGGQALQWKYQLQEFSSNNRVIAFDLRGHGSSDKPHAAYTNQQILDDLERAFEILGVAGKIVLVGHSFGGAVACDYTYCYPERVEGLILIASAGEFKLNLLYRFALKLPTPVLQALTRIYRSGLGAPPYVLQSWFTHSVSHWNGWSLFHNLALPAMVIRGHFDLVFSGSMYANVARAIPGAEEVDVGASGHMVMLERRQAVNRAITRFLEEPKRSWRGGTSYLTQELRDHLKASRPWLAHYDDNVPHTIAIPRISLSELLRSAVRRFPLHRALDFEGSRITYRRLNHEVNRFANALRTLGLAKGDRVMIMLPNLPQLVIAFFGTLKAGGVVVFPLPLSEPEEFLRQVQDSTPRFLITLEQLQDLALQARQKRPALQHIIFTRPEEYLPFFTRMATGLNKSAGGQARLNTPAQEGFHSYHPFLYSQPRKAPEVEVSHQDLAVILYTGGTTSEPKGVMLSHRNLVANAMQTRHWLPEAQEGRERFLCVLPYLHSYGLVASLIVPITIGATMILKPTFKVMDILQTIKRRRPTIFPGVPNMYMAICDAPQVRKYNVQSIKACISGAAPLPVEVQEAFEKLTRGRLVEGYGLTEAAMVTHANPFSGRRKAGSIGLPLPSTEARLVDLNGGKQEVPQGQIGELAIRGPQVMLGYWQNLKASRRALSKDGWLLTGDVAQMDGEGYFHIIARKADMWYPAQPGKPAFPRDVEEVLYEVPQVKEAAVVGIAGQPVAFVILRIKDKRERPSTESLVAYCKRRLPPELVPRLILFVDDFPRTFIGKVLRRELAKRYANRIMNG